MATPSGHTLYWIYIYYADGAYNFSTAKTVSEAKQTAKDFAGEGVPYSSIYIFYGNQDGAFTDHDAYSSRTPSSGGRRKKTTKRKPSYASRSKSGGAKRRTVTRLRHVRAAKRRGYGVMKHGASPRSYAKENRAADTPGARFTKCWECDKEDWCLKRKLKGRDLNVHLCDACARQLT